MPRLRQLDARPNDVPLRRVFASAKRESTVARNVLCIATLEDGTIGYGEGSPAEYVTGETPESVIADLAAAAQALTGVEIAHWRRWGAMLHEAIAGRTARSAAEIALLDALCRSQGIGMWEWFGGAQTTVQSDLTISLAAPEQAREWAAEAVAQGYRVLKTKVGGPDREADLARVRAVAEGAPGAPLRLDANQGFDVPGALDFLRQTQAAGVTVELIEQPLPRDDWEGMAALTAQCPVPVIADEMVVDAATAARVAREGAAHGVNIKVAKAGLLGALEIIDVARAHGLMLMLGCMLESLPGIGASVHLACGTGAFDFLDLDSHVLIGQRAAGIPFSQARDELTVPADVLGLGWAPAAP